MQAAPIPPLVFTFVCVSLAGWLAAPVTAADVTAPQTATYQRLKVRIDGIRLVDTHEHLRSEAARLKQPADCLAILLHYVEADLASAGMPRDPKNSGRVVVQNADGPFEERWEQFAKYWPDVRFTGYGRALERCVQDLYGVRLDNVSIETGRELNRRMAERLGPGFYRWVLKDKARIDLSIVDIGDTQVDRDYFAPVLRFDDFVNVQSKKQVDGLAKRTGVPIETLDDLVKALSAAFDKGVQDKMVGIKSGLAYSRRIYYPLPPIEEARSAFSKLMQNRSVGFDESLPVQNYMMHQVCRLAEQHRMPFQIHTGLQTGFGNRITNSKPTDLVDLIMAHPEVKFVLFHGGYPYGPELGTMAKNFANVYIDLCWLHIIAPKAARDYLSEWIETVPANKIMAYGGDYLFVEGAYAHAEMARKNVALVLAEKVQSGYLTERDAEELAEKLLRKNAMEVFRLLLK